MFCHSYARRFTTEPRVCCPAVLKQNGNDEKYLKSCPGENLMAKLYVSLFTLCLFLSSWIFSLILNELMKFRSQSMHDCKEKKLKESDHSKLKKTTMVVKFNVPSKRWVNAIFCPRKYVTCNTTVKWKSLLNGGIQCNYFLDFFSHCNGLVKEQTQLFSYKRKKGFSNSWASPGHWRHSSF